MEELKSALPKEELIEKLKDVYVLGIRSASDLTAEVLKSARRLLAVGCFCIGTNQVDLDAARTLGIPVFNSPFSNSRSVAELIIGQVINLARQLGVANAQMHAGQWQKYERHGRQWLRLAHARQVHEEPLRDSRQGLFRSPAAPHKLSRAVDVGHCRLRQHWNSTVRLGRSNGTARHLLRRAPQAAAGKRQSHGFSGLFAPSSGLCDATRAAGALHLGMRVWALFDPFFVFDCSFQNMIGAAQIALMKKGSYLLNASRGTVVVIDDAVAALKSGHLAGALEGCVPHAPFHVWCQARTLTCIQWNRNHPTLLSRPLCRA